MVSLSNHKRQETPFLPTKKEMQLGKWSLTPNHDLKLSLRQAKNQPFRDTITLQGKVISVDANELVFAARTRTEEELDSIRLVKLGGVWRADDQNRLTFLVKKGKEEDPLTFEGGWELGERHEILYRYQKRDLSTGVKTEELLSFRGVWDIDEKDHLTYRLDLDGKSRFDFQATLQSPSLLEKKGEIRYQVGIRLSGQKTLLREVILFGKWKVSKDFSLSFEVAYDEGRRHAIFFNTTYRLNEKNELIFSLKDQKGKGLGVEVTFTQSFFEEEGKAFLRLYKDAVESRLEGGVRVPF